ncbi:SANT/Myb_domain [Hexamita inflata]|uniref:SANT/Myb_domain n=1 Tax=Hexamita inflata TaxID=28002 RepID=A0ABP1H7A5_9EUKA
MIFDELSIQVTLQEQLKYLVIPAKFSNIYMRQYIISIKKSAGYESNLKQRHCQKHQKGYSYIQLLQLNYFVSLILQVVQQSNPLQMQNQVQLLMQKIQNQIQVRPQPVLYDIMMLPDGMYEQFFADMSMQKNISIHNLKHDFSEAVRQQFHTTTIPEISVTNNSTAQKKPLKEQFAEQKHRFAEALSQVLKEYGIDTNTADHKQMCTQVDGCIQEHGQKKFWKSMQQLMPDKTVKQLRDYYSRSFQQVLYNCQISYEDKQVLRKLMATNSHERPSSIAHYFMEQYSGEGKNYSHRNIVVYIINSLRK